MNNYILKGDICYSLNKDSIFTMENGYAVCEDGICKGVFDEIPQEYSDFPVIDYTSKLIIPGLIDLHVHAAQYAFRGLGMDMELLEWLNTRTFVEEQKYKDLEYADKAYEIFVKDMVKSPTTRACIFATIHQEATNLLMEKIEESGLVAYVGKVNMDRNSPDYLCESSAKVSVETTREWLTACRDTYENVKPILTPRFIPTCSDELMMGLGDLQKEFGIPMQSHLSENMGEIEWVQELRPDTSFYGEAYHKAGMFGDACPTIMAHCVHSEEAEMDMMEKQGVFIAHCPDSNANLSSGVAPIRTYLDRNMKVGLGSDVAGGCTISMFHVMAETIRCSKLRWRMLDQNMTPLKVEEVFYLATKGGGEFFGKVGSFETGYEFDAVVLDDSDILSPQSLSVRERLERLIYLAEGKHVIAKYVNGSKVYETE